VGTAKADNNVLIGFPVASGYDLEAFGLGLFGLINNGRVSGIQLSGLFNIADGGLAGLQHAGIFGITGGDVLGAQISGVFNTAGGNVDGFEAAGILNCAGGSLTGFQLAGILNTAGTDTTGAALAGLVNYAGGSLHGAQIAGLVNYSGGSGGAAGFQLAGIVNSMDGDFEGAQIGLVNLAGSRMSGLQLGLVNISGGEDGYAQKIGLVNISDNEEEMPIGLVNIVKNGMFHPVLWYDNMNFANAGLKSGSKVFYTLVSAGTQKLSLGKEYTLGASRSGGETLMAWRAGAGVELPLDSCYLNFDILAGEIFDAEFPEDRREASGADSSYAASSALILQARLIVGFKLFRRLGAFAGISYDWIRRHSDTSPVPGSRAGCFDFPWGTSRSVHRAGLFAGLQF
jgi:hypothetical protein